MLRYIIKKEILDIITSPKFVFTFLLCTVLILLSVYTGIVNYRAELKEYTATLALTKRTLEAQSSYQFLSTSGIKMNKPPQVLGAVVNGLEEAVGRVAPIVLTADPNLIESKYDSNPVFAVFGALDLMFIVKMVLSLFAILFTYDLIVGEKEKGTLGLALSNSLPRDTLILGKAIGGYFSLIIPLLIPVVLSLFILIISPEIALTGGDWLRLLLIFLMFFLYLSVFFSLGLFVSARTSRSSTSFLVLLFIWALFVMVIPKAAVLSAAQIKPIPSIHEVTAKKEAFLQQAQAEVRTLGLKRVQELSASAEAKKDPNVYVERVKKLLQEVQQDLASKIDSGNASIDRDYQLKKTAQQSLAVNISRISPASALTFGTMALARTGVEEYDRFLSSVRAYKRDLTKWILYKSSQPSNVKPGEVAKIKLDDMPQFQNEPESLGESLARTIPDLALMIVLIIVFFAGAYFSFRRYDVR